MQTRTRDELVSYISHGELDEFDCEDAVNIADVLLERMTPLEAMTWLAWPDAELGSTPLVLISHGRARDVLARARRLVVQ